MDKTQLTPDIFKQKVLAEYPNAVDSKGIKYSDIPAIDLLQRTLEKNPNATMKDGTKYSAYLAGDNFKTKSLAGNSGGIAGFGKSVFDFFTNATQNLGENAGQSIAAPENVQNYSDSLQSWSNTTNSLQQHIQQMKKSGKDTSKLEQALKLQNESKPELGDFVGADTAQRMRDGFVKNLEEVAGQGVGTVLESLSGGIFQSGVDTATEKGISLGSKVLKGAGLGATYGAISGASNAMSNKEGAGGVALGTAEGAVIGAGVGAATEGVVGAISNKLKGEPAFGNWAKVPKSLDGEGGAILNVPDAKETILEAQKLTKDNIKNTDLPTASEIQGDKKHTEILTKANQLLDAQGTKMSESLKNPAVGGANTDVTDIISNLNKDLKERPPVATSPDKTTFSQFMSDLNKLTGKTGETVSAGGRIGDINLPPSGKTSTLQEVDNFLRKWQKVDFSNKMQNNSVGALLDSTVHDINEFAKTTADNAETEAGVEGHPYRESNDEYRKLVTNINASTKEVAGNADSVGTDGKNTISGRYENSDKVYQQNATQNSSKSWKALAQKTGIPLGQPAALTKIVEDIYNKESADDIVEQLSLSFNLRNSIPRTMKNFIVKNEGNPDAIIEKMLQLLDSKTTK